MPAAGGGMGLRQDGAGSATTHPARDHVALPVTAKCAAARTSTRAVQACGSADGPAGASKRPVLHEAAAPVKAASPSTLESLQQCTAVCDTSGSAPSQGDLSLPDAMPATSAAFFQLRVLVHDGQGTACKAGKTPCAHRIAPYPHTCSHDRAVSDAFFGHPYYSRDLPGRNEGRRPRACPRQVVRQ